jgi:hypothetical protein
MKGGDGSPSFLRLFLAVGRVAGRVHRHAAKSLFHWTVMPSGEKGVSWLVWTQARTQLACLAEARHRDPPAREHYCIGLL